MSILGDVFVIYVVDILLGVLDDVKILYSSLLPLWHVMCSDTHKIKR